MVVRAVYWLVGFSALLLLWLLFVAQLKISEALVGIGAAALAATATEAVRGEEHPRFFPYIRWVLDARLVPWEIVKDCWLIICKLAGTIFAGSRETGVFKTVPFQAGANDARSVARRALAILYATLPPNSIVIGIDRRRNYMLLHILEGEEIPSTVARLEGRS